MSVVQEAHVHGISTRKVDDLVKAMGLAGMDKSAVSRLFQELDEQGERFRQRGVQLAIRNVLAHTEVELTTEEGLEYLVLASLLCRKIDQAKVVTTL